MTRIPMSRAAASLLRALLSRAGKQSDRILLSECRSVDWQSLTFVGERHNLLLRFTGADARVLVEDFCSGLGDAEFAIPGQIVADIAVLGAPVREADGSISIAIEALTIVE